MNTLELLTLIRTNSLEGTGNPIGGGDTNSTTVRTPVALSASSGVAGVDLRVDRESGYAVRVCDLGVVA